MWEDGNIVNLSCELTCNRYGALAWFALAFFCTEQGCLQRWTCRDLSDIPSNISALLLFYGGLRLSFKSYLLIYQLRVMHSLSRWSGIMVREPTDDPDFEETRALTIHVPEQQRDYRRSLDQTEFQIPEEGKISIVHRVTASLGKCAEVIIFSNLWIFFFHLFIYKSWTFTHSKNFSSAVDSRFVQKSSGRS